MGEAAVAMAAGARERPILFRGELVREILAGRKTVTRRPVKHLRVRLRHEVCSDIPAIIRPVIKYGPGAYPAEMNQHGAVHVTGPGGDLGVKPQEFDFLCPYADGHTYLRKHPDGRMEWNIQTSGDRLWVRETWWNAEGYPFAGPSGEPLPAVRSDLVQYAADGEPANTPNRYYPSGLRNGAFAAPDPWAMWVKRPAIHLPRRLSRLSLEVTGVRVERLQDITEEQAAAEGVEPFPLDPEGDCWTDGKHRTAFEFKWREIYGWGDEPLSWNANPWVWVVEFRKVAGHG